MIGDVLHLMLQSDVHRKWYIHDLERLIMPAIEAGKMKVFYEDGKPQGLYSHAFLTPEAAKGYLMKTRKLEPEDWFTDHESGTLYVIDMIAPYQNGFKIGRQVQKDLTDRYIDVYMKDGAFMKRVAKNDRLMYVTGVKDMLAARRAEHELRA